jgi:hypothetical protein
LAEDLLPQGSRRVLRLENAAQLQFRHQQIDHRFQTDRHHDPRQVEAIDIGFFDSGLDFVGNRGG